MNPPTDNGLKFLIEQGFTVRYTSYACTISWTHPPPEDYTEHYVRPYMGMRNIGFTEERMRLFANYCWEAASSCDENTTPDELLDEIVQALDIVDSNDVYLAGQAVRAITTMHTHRKEHELA